MVERTVDEILRDPQSRVHLNIEELEAAWKRNVEARRKKKQEAKAAYEKMIGDERKAAEKIALDKVGGGELTETDRSKILADFWDALAIQDYLKSTDRTISKNPLDEVFDRPRSLLSADSEEDMKAHSIVGDLFRFREKRRSGEYLFRRDEDTSQEDVDKGLTAGSRFLFAKKKRERKVDGEENVSDTIEHP